jgi:hypothetical protein
MYGRCTGAVHTRGRHGVISDECAARVADYSVPTQVITRVTYNECWPNECPARVRPVRVVRNECDYPGLPLRDVQRLRCTYQRKSTAPVLLHFYDNK